MTGGRVLRAKPYIEPGEPFMLTYGDGVSNVDIIALIRFHQSHGQAITMTSSQPEGRFGALDIKEGGQVSIFVEKPKGDGAWINAGFFVLSPPAIDYVAGDDTTWEREPMERLASDGQLGAWKHTGFWQPMDALRDKQHLESLWQSGQAPWKIW